MIKKSILFIALSVSLLFFIPKVEGWVESNEIGVMIQFDQLETGEYFDLLLPREQLESIELSPGINEDFIEINPNYLTFDYLNDEDWISFLAYTNTSFSIVTQVGKNTSFCSFNFRFEPNDQFIIVKINAFGEIVSESQMFIVPTMRDYQDLDFVIEYDSVLESFTLTNTISDRPLYMFFIYFFALFGVFILIIGRFLILNGLRINNDAEKKILIIYLFTTIPMVYFVVNLLVLRPEISLNYLSWLFVPGVFLFESIGIYLLLKNKEQFQRSFLYNLIAYLPYALFVLFVLFKNL